MFKLLKERLAGWRMKADTAPAEMFSDSGGRINEGKLEEVLYDLEMALLESDVALSVAKEIVDAFAENIKGKRITKKLDFDAAVRGGSSRRSRRRCPQTGSTSLILLRSRLSRRWSCSSASTGPARPQ